MKNGLISLLLFCFFVVSANAQLVFEKEEFVHNPDLLDERTEAVFKFKNIGSTTIQVTSLSASCGCTTPQLDKKTYASGESGEIKAVFTFGSRIGTQHKRITVNTIGAGQKTHLLNIVTHIPEWLELQPRVLRWKMTEPPSTQALLVEVPLHDIIKLTLPDESKNFDIRVQQSNVGKYTFLITPKTVEARVTESIKIVATATVDGKTLTRDFGAHCLIR